MTAPPITTDPLMRALLRLAVLLPALVLGACATVMPGAEAPRPDSLAYVDAGDTTIGRQLAVTASGHGGDSAFHVLTAGVDGLLTRVQMIDRAERTLDLQYFIFRGDESGRRIGAALLAAADRGVRVRLLVDDGDTLPGDEQILALDGHRGIEVRVFNPFRYRGHSRMRRALEFMFNSNRLDYRMHNKLMIADNADALIGGRNIGNQYFQIDPESQFADDDVFVYGPVTRQLAQSFDRYWNSRLAVPVHALGGGRAQADTVHDGPSKPAAPLAEVGPNADGYEARIASGEPYRSLLDGRLAATWAPVEVICDSPEKVHIAHGESPAQSMEERVVAYARSVQSELLMITPYFVPAHDELALLHDLRGRGARVAIVTNSLEAAPELSAQSGYWPHRLHLLHEGVELYEVRARPEASRGSGQPQSISRYGNYALHAKVYVFDRQRLFIGSMNFDERSKHLNTEIGLLISSAVLAGEQARRFEAIAQPDNAYAVALRGDADGPMDLVWRDREQGVAVEHHDEPARHLIDRWWVRALALLPLDGEL